MKTGLVNIEVAIKKLERMVQRQLLPECVLELPIDFICYNEHEVIVIGVNELEPVKKEYCPVEDYDTGMVTDVYRYYYEVKLKDPYGVFHYDTDGDQWYQADGFMQHRDGYCVQTWSPVSWDQLNAYTGEEVENAR